MDAEPVSAEKVQQALRAQMCAHRAMDAPKHFPAAAVLAPQQRAQGSGWGACKGTKVHEGVFGWR